MYKNNNRYLPDALDIPAIMRKEKRKLAGKKARDNGKEAERIFDSANEIWKLQKRASFVGGHPEPVIVNKKVHLASGKYTTVQEVVIKEKGSVDRVGNVGFLSAYVEIKNREKGNWRPDWNDDSFVNEFRVLQDASRTGGLAFVLAREKRPPHYVVDQWQCIPIYHDRSFPERAEWISFNIDSFPDLVLKFHQARMKRGEA